MTRNVLVLTLALCTMVLSPAAAQSDLGFKQIGFATGIVSPENLDATFSLGVLADWGTIVPRLRLESRVDWWAQSEDAGFGGEVSVRDITVGVRTKYFFPVDHKTIAPFAGGGLGLHLLKAEVSVEDPFSGQTISMEDSSTKVGLDLGGGIVTRLSPKANLFTEAWYGVVSDFSQLSLRVGFAYLLGS